MKPGRELDALVAEKVMGQTADVRERWRGNCLCGRSETCAVCSWPLSYSTDIAAAWEVVEKLDLLALYSLEGCEGEWTVRKYYNNDEWDEWDDTDGVSAPHAICLAALKAVGHSL